MNMEYENSRFTYKLSKLSRKVYHIISDYGMKKCHVGNVKSEFYIRIFNIYNKK